MDQGEATMTTTLTVGARLSALLFISFFYSTAFAGPAKVDVCHIPPSDPESFHTIRINEIALAAHLSHGDFAGACNNLCATLCDDGNACTVDDTLNCEEEGCPAFPRDPVDCSDELACTIDSCDVENGCGNEPVECVPSDLCHVSICSESDGNCAETPVVCESGDVCDLDTGECVPDTICPCFTLEELQAGGPIVQCGDNFPGFDGLTGANYADGNIACSGAKCVDSTTTASCSYSLTEISVIPISPEENGSCSALILENCNDPIQALSADAPADSSAFINQ